MARKVFADFAHVLCQRFVETPSNRDLVNLALWGGGTLFLDIIGKRATFEDFPVTPLPYSVAALVWLEEQMVRMSIPREELSGAELMVRYTVTMTLRSRGMPMPEASFSFSCVGSVVSTNRTYTSNLQAEKVWGLGEV